MRFVMRSVVGDAGHTMPVVQPGVLGVSKGTPE